MNQGKKYFLSYLMIHKILEKLSMLSLLPLALGITVSSGITVGFEIFTV